MCLEDETILKKNKQEVKLLIMCLFLKQNLTFEFIKINFCKIYWLIDFSYFLFMCTLKLFPWEF